MYDIVYCVFSFFLFGCIGEFIDNSISALRSYRHSISRQDSNSNTDIKLTDAARTFQGEIHITFFQMQDRTKRSDTKWCILISDNGCGMDDDSVKAYASMGSHKGDRRDKDAENFRNKEAIIKDAKNLYMNVDISQFGVGAKQAGFHLGESVTCISKKAGNTEVLELNMERTKMVQCFCYIFVYFTYVMLTVY